MKLDNVFKKTRIAVGRKNYITFTRRPEVPEGLLRKCNKCGGAIIAEDVKKDHYICPKCGGYFRVHARRRIEMITDEGSFEEWDSDLQGGNPLEYKGYEEKLKKLQEKTGLSEAVVTGKAKIDGREGGRTGNERKTSGHLICLLRRGPYAGGNRLSDADGKDIRSTEAPQ